MKRLQYDAILKDLPKKMVFLVGPRQAGKTWLAKEIAKSFKHSVYLNYDRLEDREIIKNESWLDSTDFLVLDELHKMPNWKQYIKGVFDTKLDHLCILITGSARLDTFHSAGDSLAGRYFVHHLLPFSPAELSETEHTQNIDRLMERGGFPEPFLMQASEDADRWRKQYTNGLIREDILDFERIYDLRAIELILNLLRTRVGSPVSYSSIARDVSISPTTAKKYIEILEALYIVFRVTPFTHNIARSLLKEPKIYFFDTAMVENEIGKRYENMVAVSLLKYVYERNDYLGHRASLNYLRTKEGKEVDFCITQHTSIEQLIEAKHGERTIDPSLAHFSKKYNVPGIQLVKEIKNEFIENDNSTVCRAQEFLERLSILRAQKNHEGRS
ncbi:MAG: ATP-binding protein [Candidatus Kerfeldbacteria bacterium]|nr:ATP-binding protein [Candidatus Kerfeldbacteria bacterium]